MVVSRRRSDLQTKQQSKKSLLTEFSVRQPASRPSIHPSAGTQQKQSSSNRNSNSNICVFCWPQRASERMGRVCACMCFYFIHIHSSIDINSPPTIEPKLLHKQNVLPRTATKNETNMQPVSWVWTRALFATHTRFVKTTLQGGLGYSGKPIKGVLSI